LLTKYKKYAAGETFSSLFINKAIVKQWGLPHHLVSAFLLVKLFFAKEKVVFELPCPFGQWIFVATIKGV